MAPVSARSALKAQTLKPLLFNNQLRFNAYKVGLWRCPLWGLVLSKDGQWAGVGPVGSSAVNRTGCQVSNATYLPGLKRSCWHIPGKSKCWWPFITSVTMQASNSGDTPLHFSLIVMGLDIALSANWLMSPAGCLIGVLSSVFDILFCCFVLFCCYNFVLLLLVCLSFWLSYFSFVFSWFLIFFLLSSFSWFSSSYYYCSFSLFYF